MQQYQQQSLQVEQGRAKEMSSELLDEAKIHFEKIRKSLTYHKSRLEQDLPEGVKFMVKREVGALEFLLKFAKEGLEAQGVDVSEL